MRRRVIFLALGLATVAGVGTATAASALGSNPSTVGPGTSHSRSVEPGDDHGGLRPPGVSDDPAGHDANDPDHQNRDRDGADDPAGHDVGDDHGGLRPPGVSDDPAGHDANDPDHQDRNRDGADDPAGHDAGDDRGGDRGGDR